MTGQVQPAPTTGQASNQHSSIQPDYRWQEALKGEVFVPQTATFVGVGGFGSWAALLVALSGTAEVILIDPGQVDAVDLARSPYLPSTVGTPKVEALAAVLKSFRQDLAIELHQLRFEGEQQADLLRGVVFNGISNNEIDQDLWMICGARGLKCVSGVYAGTEAGTFTTRPSNMIIEKDGPVWVGSAAISAFLAVHSALVKNLHFLGSVDELNGVPFRSGRNVGTMRWRR